MRVLKHHCALRRKVQKASKDPISLHSQARGCQPCLPKGLELRVDDGRVSHEQQLLHRRASHNLIQRARNACEWLVVPLMQLLHCSQHAHPG